jgi:multicomponent K+:H+ antiporter subunit G
VVQSSFASQQLYVHALLITLFTALTTPVTTIFLMRAAMFRARLRGEAIPMPISNEPRGPQP